MRRGHRERSTACANRCCGHLVSSESCCEVWCSPARGSLSRFKCHSDARSTFSCSTRTLAAACDAVQFGARVAGFFGDSGRTSFMLQGAFRFVRRWAFRSPMEEHVLRFSGACVSRCMRFDFFTSSLQHNQITKRMSLVRIGLWRHSAFAHVRIRRLCDTFNGSARQHL